VTNPRKTYPFRRPAELGGGRRHCAVIIAGAGPVGLAAARDLGTHGIECIVIDDDDKVASGSRAICWAKRTLEIFDRLGCAAPMMAKGVRWSTGKVFFGDSREPLYSFDLQPEKDECFPAFINLQQYYAEEFLIDALQRTPAAELRWSSRLVSVRELGDRVEVDVETPHGSYALSADYLIAADGCRSTVRSQLGLQFTGEAFQDHFLIADVRMHAQRPAERWFWFDPPFARGQSALLHKQPDDVWRLDFQLGWDIDRDRELDPARITERVRRMLGADTRFELVWASIYTFQCRSLEKFVHGRVLFAGDSAHVVSPFGARGGNGGVQDVDNLCWKLAYVLRGLAPQQLLASYDLERVPAAQENLLHSTRSTDFITPKTPMSRALRNAVLELARSHEFARAFVNSGRLSTPAMLRDSPLNTADIDPFAGPLVPGSPAIDGAMLRAGLSTWFLRELARGFTLVVFTNRAQPERLELDLPVPVTVLHIAPAMDVSGKLARVHDAAEGSCYLYRPDQHLAARWRGVNPERVRAAVLRALAKSTRMD
jgi:3-(3-hydroxy-phenyl)propionate hydroxylase